MITSRRRAAPATMAGVAVVAAGLYLVNPNTTHVPLCPLHALTGLQCPLCGSTRAVYALLHADPMTALHDNALFVATLPLLALWWWLARSGWRLPRAALWTFIGVAAGFGVLRNCDIGSWLVPPT